MQILERTSKSALSTLCLLAALMVAMAVPPTGLAAPGEPAQLSFSPSGYDFGLQPVHSGGYGANFELRNDGAEGVPVESLEIVGEGASAFWFGYSNCWGAFLQPGESCSAQVYFGPNEIGDYAAELRAGANSSQFSAALSGSGGMAVLAPEANPVDFGVAKVGAAGNVREISISNVGNLPGGVFIAVISGGAVGSFQLLDENCTNHEIAPAQSCTAQVRFQPTSEGVKKATLSLFGDGDGGAQVVLTGMGAAPDPFASAAVGLAEASTPAAAAQHKAKQRKRKRQVQRHKRRIALAAARISGRR